MTTKIAVSLPDELVAEARAAVDEGRAASVSAYVAEALAEKSRRHSLDDLLTEWVGALGPATPQDEEWVAQAMSRLGSPT